MADDEIGFFAVQFKTDCPHILEHVNEDLPDYVNINASCQSCGLVGENWLCLKCFSVHCSRYKNACHQVHAMDSGHHIGKSFGDLSIWCNLCDSYIKSPMLRGISDLVYEAKFDNRDPALASQGAAATTFDEIIRQQHAPASRRIEGHTDLSTLIRDAVAAASLNANEPATRPASEEELSLVKEELWSHTDTVLLSAEAAREAAGRVKEQNEEPQEAKKEEDSEGSGAAAAAAASSSSSSAAAAASPEGVEKVDEIICPICCESFALGERTARLPCPCVVPFHMSCLRRWLQAKAGCPTCRAELSDLLQAAKDTAAAGKGEESTAEVGGKEEGS
uniref:RING-type domain-containing protein n=1 Tax=Chromera velia CCMP2878 TaxID=1169474 RepID=A0A0G4EYI6_9ALVE|eukprot:Cvel_2541.t1-p1 / transcript=Cvel_2541.t1 / gene=Cvel_2541 / organism=Chromera_velia_CCMP2878 / gene_product=Histone deacetylase 6, putative / transcript_product=Histone deacetylase 6, putative / location=Cvel_scaffold100:75047-76045(+) / protein_length=333 / sequence_SO=supercontig / SO=protein_coding / is_pseudo=false